jgi:hypothetical protein
MDSGAQSVYCDLVYVNKDNSKVIRYWKAGEYKEGLIKWGDFFNRCVKII